MIPAPVADSARFHLEGGGGLDDSVVVDAKRILLRYGAPISALDAVGEVDRVRYAREVARTDLVDREDRLRILLIEGGYLDPSTPPRKRPRKRR